MKIGHTDYNVKAIKEMGFKEFDKLYKDRISDTKEVYEQITGEKVEEKEIKEDFEKPLPKSLVSKKEK